MSKLALIGNVRIEGEVMKGTPIHCETNNTSNVNKSVSAIVTHRPDQLNSTHYCFDGAHTKKLTSVFVMTGYEGKKINRGRRKFIIRNYLWNLLSNFYSV